MHLVEIIQCDKFLFCSVRCVCVGSMQVVLESQTGHFQRSMSAMCVKTHQVCVC